MRRNGIIIKKQFTMVLSMFLIITMVAAYLPIGESTVLANEGTPIATDKVTITEVVSDEGFTHPGIGLTKEILENMRTQVIAKKDPWYTYYDWMSKSGYASKVFASNLFASSNPDGTDNPRTHAVNNKGAFVADGLRAYTQVIMYYITGDEAYRVNAMRIIRLWEQMDPSQYTYFTDSHIHMGIPLNRMVAAAEILRYSSAENEDPKWKWTEEDTAKFTTNLIEPMTETFLYFNDKFMNQHLYPLLGAMSGYIFTDNLDRYEEGVEWFTVNKTAIDQGQNGSIKQLFRLVTEDIITGEPINPPRVQHVEMGRDQAHGAGDLTNVEILGRLLEAQGTKVDPKEGTLSISQDAISVYEYLDNRVLEASNYFGQFMMGYDTPWTPVAAHTDPDGNPTIIYKNISGAYRGRIGGNVYGQYYYYKYQMGLDMEQVAPYYMEMFNKRHPFWWESPDGGADYWMFIPKEAEVEGASTLPKVSPDPNFNDIELRTTALDNYSVVKQEDDTGYVEITATENGSKVAFVASGTGEKTVGIKIRTNSTAKLEINGWTEDTIVLPDTKGQWKYVTFTMNAFQGLGDLIYFKVIGSGTTVDIDHFHLKAAEQLTPPAFETGSTLLNLYGYTGSKSTLRYDFSAEDAGMDDKLSYEINHKPEGAVFDENTGAFTWQPEQEGTYSFVVSATDGTTVTARSVVITVTHDRQSAIEAVVTAFDEEKTYLSSTLKAYKTVYEDIMNAVATVPDEDFYQKLSELNVAVQNLKELTPLMNDGSMNYINMVVTSTFGTQIANLVDGAPDSFAGYYLADNLSYTMDFGTDFKIAVDKIGLQVRASFPERIGGVAVFGSNDMATWTRLNQELSVVSEDMQELEVSDEHKKTSFRFLKLHMIEPSSTMFEMAELRIFGERKENDSKIPSVSLSSAESENERVDVGDTVQLSFQSTEPIRDVQVFIQGKQANLISDDQQNWSATAVMDSSTPTGQLQFTIDYHTADGKPAAQITMTTDNTRLYLVNRAKFIDVPRLAEVFASDNQWGNGLSKEEIGYLLFDGKKDTFGDLATSKGSYYTLDFGANGNVKLSDVIMLPRSGMVARMNGVVLQGSNDNEIWNDLTPAVTEAKNDTWTYISNAQFLDNHAYRYVRIFNSGDWSGNIAEVEMYGDFETQSIDSMVKDSDGYTKLSYYLYMQEVDRIRLAISLPGSDKQALINELFRAEGLLVSVTDLPTEKFTIDSSMVTASTVPWSGGGTAEENGWRAFDNDINTFTDTKENPSWILINMGENNMVSLGTFKFYPRNPSTNHIQRVNGAILQGSHDGINFSDLHTISGVSSAQWYTVPINNEESFQYVRYYSPAGNSNVAELEFYKETIDHTLLEFLLEKAEALEEGEYDKDRYAVMLEAKSTAQEIADAEISNQAQIDEAAANLLQALKQLEAQVDIINLKPVEVMTSVGVAPMLPTVVSAVYSDETVKLVPVEWETIDPAKYEHPGDFSVTGAVYGTTLPAVAKIVVMDEEVLLPPTNLQASSITTNSLVLNWTAPTGNKSVTGYEVITNEQLAGTVTHDTYKYSINDLSPDTSYIFKVVAFDEAGNRAVSDGYTVKTAALEQNPVDNVTTTPPASSSYGSVQNKEKSQVDIKGNEIQVELDVKNGSSQLTLSIENVSTAISNAVNDKDSTLLIDLKAEEKVSSFVLKLPVEAWNQAKEAGIQHIMIRSGLVMLTINTNGITELPKEGLIALEVRAMSQDAEAASSSGKFKDKPVYEFILSVDGKNVETLNGNRAMKIQIPYTLHDGELHHSIVAESVHNLRYEIVRSSKYDEGSGYLTFYVNHLGKYTVGYNPVVFKDMTTYSWAQDSVDVLAARQIINGIGDNRFAPERKITRAEFVKMITEAFEMVQKGKTSTLSDVKAGEWYSEPVATAQALHIVTGYEDGTFGVDQEITREEVAVMVVRILKVAGIQLPKENITVTYQDTPKIARYAEEAVKVLSEAGYMKGQGENLFAPKEKTTRAEVAVLIARILDLA
ncbi:S-layer homology domain-containing protein [Paenibacillus sp. GYB006]|uniref:S-layer homology domain-containing protein n=1 Tax=Paenibacillus sp. GYB006 TaxID=2994394 RepID=UPI002F96A7D3